MDIMSANLFTKMSTGQLMPRAFRFMLQHYIGKYLSQPLQLDDLGLNPVNGEVCINHVSLSVQTINKLLEEHGIPLKLVDGYVASIRIKIPWKLILSQDMTVEIDGLQLTIHPNSSTAFDLDENMFSDAAHSMSTSTAEHCFSDQNQTPTSDGLEAFAHTIEDILKRVRVIATNTIVRLEHSHDDVSTGVALQVHIGRLEYFDDQNRDIGSSTDERTIPESSAIVIKNIHIRDGLEIETDVFFPLSRSGGGTSCPFGANQSLDGSTNSSMWFTSALESQTLHQPIVKPPSYITQSSTGGLPHEQTSFDSHPTRILEARGLNQIQIKSRGDEVSGSQGPKTEISAKLSSIGIFASPKQLQIVTEVIKAFTDALESSPEDQLSDLPYSRPFPADPASYPGSGYLHRYPGSPPNSFSQNLLTEQLLRTTLDEESSQIDASSVESELFASIGGQSMRSDLMSTSIYSSRSGSTLTGASLPTDSNLHQHMHERAKRGNFKPSTRHRRSKNTAHISDDSRSQCTRVTVDVAFLTAAVLHEHPSGSVDRMEGGVRDVEILEHQSKRFFEGFQSTSTAGVLNLVELRERIQPHVDASHLLLLVKKIAVELNSTSTRRTKIVESDNKLSLVIGHMELTEWLKPERIEVICYTPPNPLTEVLTFTTDISSNQPCIRLKLNSKNYQAKPEVQGRPPPPSIDVQMEIGRAFNLEVDVSIIDRIQELLKPSPVMKKPPEKPAQPLLDPSYQDFPPRPRIDLEKAKTTSRVNLKCLAQASIFLRVPIADLRGPPDCFSWRRRNLRNEKFEFVMTYPSLTLGTSSHHCQNERVEIDMRSLRGYFLSPKHGRIAFANIGQDVIESQQMSCIEGPRIVITTTPPVTGVRLDRVDSDETYDSLNIYLDTDVLNSSSIPSPFSDTRAIVNGHEVKMPASKAGLREFENKTRSNTELHIEIFLPALNLVIPNKTVLDEIYNYLVNDLLMWAPLNPSLQKETYNSELNNFQFHKPHGYDSDSSDDDERLYSIHTPAQKERLKRQPKVQNFPSSGDQSKTCVEVKIKRGRVTINHLMKPGDEQTESYSQTALDVSDGVIYVNVNASGDPNLQYIGIHSSQVTLYHSGNVPGPYVQPCDVERLVYTIPPVNLNKLIELSSPNLLSSGAPTQAADSEYMFRLAIRISMDTAAGKHIKNMLISIAIRSALLHHSVSTLDEMWIFKIMDSLSLNDNDVLGYPWPQVITELHLHIQNSAILYRPIDHVTSALLTLDRFSLSSNVVVTSRVSVLQLLFEDIGLHLCQLPVETKRLRLESDFASVSKLKHLSVESRTCKGTYRNPEVEVKVNVGVLEFMVCSDSLQAFIDLIDHYHTVLEKVNALSNDTSKQSMMGEVSSSEDGPIEDMSNDISDQSKDMVQSILRGPMQRSILPADMFLQSDDDALHSQLSDAMQDSTEEFDEWQMVDDACFVPKCREPVINKLTDGPITLKENHLATPTKRVDLLNPPKEFPSPQQKFTLEATLNLYFYGGYDFTTLKSLPGRRHQGAKSRDKKTCVQLHLSRIRARYDVYPNNKTQANRLCLMIQELEIIDRVSISKINKMLHLWYSEDYPKLDHAGMLMVKLLCVRPNLQLTSNTEWNIRAAIQPLVLNVDQDTLWFLLDFLKDLQSSPDDISDPERSDLESIEAPAILPVLNEPSVVNAEIGGTGEVAYDEMQRSEEVANGGREDTPFIKTCILESGVVVHVSYVGKRRVLDNTIAGFFAGLAQLNNSVISLKPLHYRQGISGWGRMFSLIKDDWIKDMPRQIPSIICGIGPLYSFKTIGDGIYGLFSLPVEQYMKDGRIVRGLQRGVAGFGKNTASGLLGLGIDSVNLFGKTVSAMNDVLTPGQPFQTSGKVVERPRDTKEGLVAGYDAFSQEFGDMKKQISQNFSRERETKGARGVLSAAVQMVPTAIMRPVIATARAAENVMTGVAHGIEPTKYRDYSEKYKPQVRSSRDT